jgi:hypothetical protein
VFLPENLFMQGLRLDLPACVDLRGFPEGGRGLTFKKSWGMTGPPPPIITFSLWANQSGWRWGFEKKMRRAILKNPKTSNHWRVREDSNLRHTDCSGIFPVGMRWFLLNKLFQMRPAEIARMEGVKNPHVVRGMIIRVSDQLRCGEISLFENDPEEAEGAKARLEAKRAQRRKRYAARRGGVRVPLTQEEKKAKRKAYRDANKERINAKRQ